MKETKKKAFNTRSRLLELEREKDSIRQHIREIEARLDGRLAELELVWYEKYRKMCSDIEKETKEIGFRCAEEIRVFEIMVENEKRENFRPSNEIAELTEELEKNKKSGDMSFDPGKTESEVRQMTKTEWNEFEQYIEEKYEAEREEIDRNQTDLKESFAVYARQLFDEFYLAVDVSVNETLAEEGIKIDILKLQLNNVQRLLDIERDELVDEESTNQSYMLNTC